MERAVGVVQRHLFVVAQRPDADDGAPVQALVAARGRAVLPRSHPPSAIDGNPEVSRFNFYLFFCLFVFRSLFLGSMDRLGLIVGREPFVCLFVCLFFHTKSAGLGTQI